MLQVLHLLSGKDGESMLKKTLIMLPIMLLFLMSSIVYAESSDYETNWASKEITKWQSSGIVSGYPDGNFRPDAPITRAEFFKLIAETMGLTEIVQTNFKDVSADAWYTDYIAKAVSAGYVQGDGDHNVRPNDPITRQEVAKVLSMAFNVPAAANEANSFKDAKDIAEWSRGYVGGLAQAGYISGYGDQSFKPDRQITRAESVKMFDNLAGELFVRPGTYSDLDVPGNALINKKGVTLKNVKIKGNLYVTAGTGEDNVILDNITVTGEVVITGEHTSITISGNSNIDSIKIFADGVKINGHAEEKGSVVKVENGIVTVITDPTNPTNPTNPTEPSNPTSSTSRTYYPTYPTDSTDSTDPTNPTNPNSGGDSSVHVTGVSLNQTATSLKVGETITLTATVAPANADNKNVRWSSSNESVAIVENGKITAKAEGTAVITVTTDDGSKTASCTVTVTKQVKEGVIYDVTTTVNDASKKVTLEGFVGSGSGKAVTVKITDPQGNVDWIGQTVSGTEGKFTFTFTPNNKIQGEFTAALGTNGLATPVLVKFKYLAD
jgi:hypothetical protein